MLALQNLDFWQMVLQEKNEIFQKVWFLTRGQNTLNLLEHEQSLYSFPSKER